MTTSDSTKDKLYSIKTIWRKRAGFSCLRYVSCSQDGDYFISDTGAKKVFIFDKQGKNKGVLGKEGLEAYSLCFAPDGNYVAVAAVDSIKVFDLRNREEEVLAFGKGVLGGATGVACNTVGQFIVSDSWTHKILTFNNTGELIDSFGSKGDTSYKFKYPYYVCVDLRNNVIVSDHMNCCIKVFDPNGIFLAKHTACGGSRYYLGRPRSMDVDMYGNIYVADTDNDRIAVIPFEGETLNQDIQYLDDLFKTHRFVKPSVVSLSENLQSFAVLSNREAELSVYYLLKLYINKL